MTSTTTCGGPTTSGSTPPSDTGARRNSPNRDSSSKKPSNTPLPIHLVLYGPVGTGKTHLAVALGRLACMRAIPVRFFTATGLLMRLRRAKREDRLDAELRQIARARLLIIDEFGYMPIDEEGSRFLFQVISDSYETRSMVHIMNIEFSGWGRVLGDKNMAAALIDRTVHHGRLVRFEGGSYRSEHALMTR